MILVIDNYDSFTFNLVHYLIELGADVRVERNDALTAAGDVLCWGRGVLTPQKVAGLGGSATALAVGAVAARCRIPAQHLRGRCQPAAAVVAPRPTPAGAAVRHACAFVAAG